MFNVCFFNTIRSRVNKSLNQTRMKLDFFSRESPVTWHVTKNYLIGTKRVFRGELPKILESHEESGEVKLISATNDGVYAKLNEIRTLHEVQETHSFHNKQVFW